MALHGCAVLQNLLYVTIKGISMNLSNFALYFFVIGFGFYFILIVPYFSSKILIKYGNNERFWFFIVITFNIYLLIGIMFLNKYRRKLSFSEKYIFLGFILGYFAFFLPIIFILG